MIQKRALNRKTRFALLGYRISTGTESPATLVLIKVTFSCGRSLYLPLSKCNYCGPKKGTGCGTGLNFMELLSTTICLA